MSFSVPVEPPTEACEDRSKPFSRVYYSQRTCVGLKYPMTKRINLEGQEFGRLTVPRLAQIDLHGRTHWLCLCQCGQLIVVLAAQLRRGNTRSCGCLQREQSRKHFTTTAIANQRNIELG